MTARDLEIAIHGIAVWGRHGVLPEERALGQRFRIDLRLVPRSTAACDSDDVADAVDYAAAVAITLAAAEEGPFDLLERLADVVARRLLERLPLLEARVTVHKPAAPVPALLDDVAVTVTRRA